MLKKFLQAEEKIPDENTEMKEKTENTRKSKQMGNYKQMLNTQNTNFNVFKI